MGNEEDITRLRADINEIYNQFRDLLARVVTLEERSNNRDDKIEELKTSIKALETELAGKLDSLAAQVTTLINAPAQRVAGRWDEAIKTVLTVAITALVMYALARMGIK